MIRKSGHRFSEKIMLKHEDESLRSRLYGVLTAFAASIEYPSRAASKGGTFCFRMTDHSRERANPGVFNGRSQPFSDRHDQ